MNSYTLIAFFSLNDELGDTILIFFQIRGGKEKHPFYLQPGSTGAFSKTSNGSDNGVRSNGTTCFLFKTIIYLSPFKFFLWRQTSPFIRPKFSKMHEATCMEIKEACKIFEKVLIQNIRFGLSPSFTDALTLISRWKFIVATLPHVIQCSAALLQHRKESSFNLGSSETKLLYTLHWILLDAADECSLDEYEKAGKIDTSPFAYLFPLSSITTFIYLFAPICSNVRESDFMQNFRLENGKKIWKALWDFNQPDVPCFSAKVKPRKPSLRDLKKTRSKNKGANQQGMFKEDEADKKSETPKTDNGENPSADKPVRKSLLSTPFANPPTLTSASITLNFFNKAPNSNSSSIANPSKLKDSKGGNNPFGNKVRKKEDDESALASYFDIAVLRCLYISYWSEEGVYWALTFFQKKLRGLTYGMYNGKLNGEPSTNGSDPSNPRKRSNSLPIPQIEVTFAKDSNSQKTNEIESSELENGNMSTIQSNHNRTTSLSEKTIKGSRIRKKSLISGLEVGKLKCFKSFVESKILSKSDRALDAESSHNVLSALPSKKEMYRRRSSGASICDFATRALALERSRSKSTVGCTYGLEGKPGISKAPPLEKHTLLSSNNSRLVKGKSMPSLSYLIDELKEKGYYGLRKVSTPNSLHKTEKYQKRMMSKPIITVTEFTPITTPDKRVQQQWTPHPLDHNPLSTSLITNTENQPTPLVNMSGSNGNRANSEMCSFGEAIPPQVGVAAAVVNAAVNHSSALVPRPAHLFRSRTDSKIDYVVNGQMEAPGSTFYINKFGEIDYVILLKALHKISLREYICTSRVCEALLSLLSSLIDVGLLTNKSNENPSFSTSNNANNQSKKSQPKMTKEDIPVSTPNDKSLSIHNIFMDITVRNLKKYFAVLLKTEKDVPFVTCFLHAYLNTCIESAAISPAPKPMGGARKRSSKINQEMNLAYANNFGENAENAPKPIMASAESIILSSLFKKIITCSVSKTLSLRAPENVVIYTDIRNLVNYVRVSHAFNWLTGKAGTDYYEDGSSFPHTTPSPGGGLQPSGGSFVVNNMCDGNFGSEDFGISSKAGEFIPSTLPPSRKVSVHSRSQQRLNKNANSKTMLRMAKRTFTEKIGINRSRKKETELEDPYYEISRCNSYDFETGTKDSVSVYFRERLHVPIDSIQIGLDRFSFLLETSNPGTVPDSLLIAALLDLPKAPIITRACYLLECAYFVQQCNKGQWPIWLKNNDLTPNLFKREPFSLQLQAAKMFHQWAEMLGSRIDELLTVESNQTLNNVSNSNDETRQRQLLLEDDEEDFLDEASVNPNSQSTNCPTVLKLVACVLLLEITAFMRETYKILPKTHLTKTSGATPNVINIPSKPTGGSIVASGIGGSISATSAGRRWSMATQSLNIGNLSMDSPSGMMTTSATSTSNMTGGGATTPGSTQDHRKISFVIQNEDNDSANSSQTTLTVQGDSLDTTGTDKRSTGPRIVQGKPKIVKPGGSFKRRSIRLKKGSGGECNSERSYVPLGDLEEIMDLVKSPSTNTSAVLKMDGSGGSLGPGAPDVRNPSTSVGSTGSGGASKPARTTIFINRLALKRADSATAAAKRKVSAISVSDVSDFETGEDSPGPEESFKDSDTHLYEVFEDSDVVNLDQNMPWLNVVSKLINSLNYYCTHQTFCYSNCYRRQMRAAKRIMEAASTIYGYETEFTEEFANGMNQQHGLGETTDAQQDFHRRKMSRKGKGPKTDSNSTSPDRKKDNNLVVSLDPEKGGLPDILGNDPPLQTSITAPHSLGSLNNGEKQSQGDKIPGNYSSEKKNEEPKPILKYLQQRVRSLFHIPLYVINKSSCILSESIFLELLPVTWELLLEADKDVVGAAASLFIVSSVKIPTQCLDLISSELNHQLPDQRISAIQRFQVLWQNRQQVWQRLEENGQISMKVTPSQIEFTLPSPKLGVESLPVIDPCWIPRYKTKIEDVTIQHDKSQMLLSATKSRKKQQSELIQSVIYAEEEKRRKERENFHITSVPVTMRAAYEPSLYNGGNVDEHDEGDEDNNETDKTTPKSSYQIAQTLFPSTLCSAFMEIITLLEDQAVSLDGIAVYEVAYQLIWSCLRKSLESFESSYAFFLNYLNKLLFSLYNYIIGYIMFYVRHPRDKAQELIGQALATLWMVVHSVQGIMFKDLKQILRKEQVDAAILLTANVPAAKKIVVHGPQGPDEGGIPSQFPLGEDVQFCQILQEAQDFFGIDDEVSKEYFLVDHKTKTIHNPQHHARDYYFFKRTQYPQLSLVHKEPATAYDELQKQCYSNKFVEIGKVMLIWGVLKNVSQVVQRVVFLHEDLMKLPSFPRKALESELDLHTNGKMGKELHGLDVLHKFNWIHVHLFINVICGALALHAEDSCILRYCFATIINAAHQFKNIFSNSGYFLVMPSLLRIYSNNQTNRLITTTIEFVCKQLYVLHRKPFLLQMFGSIAPILDRDDDTAYGDAFKIQPKCLYKLLSSLSYRTADNLNIMELVRLKKPLTALDFCYSGEPENISVIECISLCVLVVAYDSSTKRARQMLRILEAIMPYFLRDLVSDKKMDTKTVRDMIHQLTVTMKVLLNNCDELTKNYSGPTNQGGVDDRKTRLHSSRGGPYSPVIEIDEDSHSRYIGAMGDSSRTARGVGNNTDDLLDSEWKRDSYCSPRNSILLLTGEFIIMCSTKLSEINKKTSSEKQLELMDNKCYMKLVDIAHSLLKMAPYDLDVMKLGGLQKYMNEIFPITDWSVESMRPSLLTILRRLDKLFTKIHKSPKVYHVVDWTAAAGLLHGVYTTVWKYPYIVNLTNLKSLIATCQCLIVGEDSLSGLTDIHAGRSNNIRRNELPPKEFCSVIFQLIALQVLVLGDTYTLEQRLQLSDNNQIALYSLLTHDKGESLLLNLLLPLCLNVGCGRKDVPKLRKSDVKFALNLLLTLLNPKSANRKDHNQHELLTISTSHNTIGAGSYNDGIASSGGACSGLYNTATDVRSKNKHSSLEIGFLGLKIIITCFDYQLNDEWFRIARIIREMGNRQEGNGPLWRFLDFISTQRSPLYTLLLPFIHNRAQLFADSEPERHFHLERARERITVSSGSKSKSLVLDEFGKELEELRDNLNKRIQESFLDLSNGSRRHTGRGSSQRNSFIEYVSEVYNRGTAGYNSSNDKCGNLPMESLSARGHSISSGGSGVSANSFSATLRRNLSIRSENLPQSNKVLGLQRNTKSSRSTGVYRTMVTEKIPRRTSYSGEQTLDPHGSHLQPKNATSEPRLYRKSTIFSRHRHIKSRHGRSRQSVLSDPGGNDSNISNNPSTSSSSGGGIILQPNNGVDSVNNLRPKSPVPGRGKLQRQKAQSRKTFKLHKTRKEIKEARTMMKNLSSIEIPETGGVSNDLQQLSVRTIPNQSLSTVDSVIKRISPTCKTGKYPFATDVAVHICSSSKSPPKDSKVIDMEGITLVDAGDDSMSISSRGTSSTIGYRDSFGEMEEGNLLSIQERGHEFHFPSCSITEQSNAMNNSSSHEVMPMALKRKNYIIFEQNDEDTLI
ncbi:UNC80 [Lepeophtheirus salmonis]|uniref:UNC80 n=1 Tax=Lepeophtheirus salmonis TaxID=72036 RepID=A0A7R8H019_LEPSM|nr:UNC80 [Lepeophtheirus salmonis]CAF2761917.1 UNC80 [Lepeophtheirus salmonis]